MMQLQSPQKTIKNQLKPQNKLLLQSTNQARVFYVYSLDDALEKMIKIYGEAMTLTNAANSQTSDTVRFSLKSMIQYYSGMDDIQFIEYIQKENSSNQKEKHKMQMESYNKQFVLASLKTYCVKKSTEKSIQLAKLIYQNGEDAEEVLKNMGFVDK